MTPTCTQTVCTNAVESVRYRKCFEGRSLLKVDTPAAEKGRKNEAENVLLNDDQRPRNEVTRDAEINCKKLSREI